MENQITSIAFLLYLDGVFCFPAGAGGGDRGGDGCWFLKQNESVRQVIFDVYTDQDLVIYQKLLEQER